MAAKAIKMATTVPIEKVWLSRKEVAAFLGITERSVRDAIEMNPIVEVFKINSKITLYSVDSINKLVRKSRI